MRRKLIAQAANRRCPLFRDLFTQGCKFATQDVDLLLLTVNGLAELLEEVVCQTRLDF